MQTCFKHGQGMIFTRLSLRQNVMTKFMHRARMNTLEKGLHSFQTCPF